MNEMREKTARIQNLVFEVSVRTRELVRVVEGRVVGEVVARRTCGVPGTPTG